MYRVIRAILKIFAWIAFRMESVHLPDQRPDTPLLLCPNHQSMLDIVAMIVTYPEPLVFVAKEELAHSVLGPIYKRLGTIFVDRDRVGMSTIRSILSCMEKNQPVVIFPEGTRVKEVDPANMKEGVSFIAQKSGAALLPVYIEADYRFRGRVRVHYRALLDQGPFQDLPKKDQRQALTTALFEAIYDRKEQRAQAGPKEKKGDGDGN